MPALPKLFKRRNKGAESSLPHLMSKKIYKNIRLVLEHIYMYTPHAVPSYLFFASSAV